MKCLKLGWILALVLAILPLSAFAASSSTDHQQSKTINLDEKAQVAGTQLKPGDYKLTWDENQGDSTNVSFQQGKRTVATVPARIVHVKKAPDVNFEFNTANGENALDRVYLSHEILEFGRSGMKNNNSNTNPGQ